MANTKYVEIAGSIPFHWPQDLDPEDAAFVASWLVGPSTGLVLRYGESHMRDNDHGGRTTIYDFTLAGTEAISHPALRRMVAILGGFEFAEIRIATAEDMTDPGGGAEEIEPMDAEELAESRAKQARYRALDAERAGVSS